MAGVSNEGLPQRYEWFSDQIAGHHPSVIKNGKREIGILKEPGSCEILKPKQDASRGDREVALYELLHPRHATQLSRCSDLRNGRPEDIEMLRSISANFLGVHKLFVDGEDREFLMLDDVTSDFINPGILDLKMGRVTYDPLATPEKIEKERVKYPAQETLGMRILGYRVHRLGGVVIARDKEWGKSLDENTIHDGLLEFFTAQNKRSFHKEGLQLALKQLQKIKHFFETQRSFLFFASSLLFVYDADRPTFFKIIMIDFSHVFPSNGERDEGYLFGVLNLEKILQKLLDDAENNAKKT